MGVDPWYGEWTISNEGHLGFRYMFLQSTSFCLSIYLSILFFSVIFYALFYSLFSSLFSSLFYSILFYLYIYRYTHSLYNAVSWRIQFANMNQIHKSRIGRAVVIELTLHVGPGRPGGNLKLKNWLRMLTRSLVENKHSRRRREIFKCLRMVMKSIVQDSMLNRESFWIAWVAESGKLLHQELLNRSCWIAVLKSGVAESLVELECVPTECSCKAHKAAEYQSARSVLDYTIQLIGLEPKCNPETCCLLQYWNTTSYTPGFEAR